MNPENNNIIVLAYSIRQATQQDSDAIARLTTQLGYPASTEKMGVRLGRILANPTDSVFVAEARETGTVVGWVHGALSQYLEADYRVEIAGLIVDERFHRNGIGRALLRRIEEWAATHGATQASVRCRSTRPQAHLFYEKQGYSRTKTQIVFRKNL